MVERKLEKVSVIHWNIQRQTEPNYVLQQELIDERELQIFFYKDEINDFLSYYTNSWFVVASE